MRFQNPFELYLYYIHGVYNLPLENILQQGPITDFFPMVPRMEFLFTLWYPKGSKNKNYRAPLQNIF